MTADEGASNDGGGTRAGWLRRSGQSALVVLAGLLVAVALAEVLLRTVAPQYLRLHLHPSNVMRDRFINHDRLGVYDELLGWKFQADAVGVNRGMEFQHEIRTNSRGYRDDEFVTGNDDAVRRIVLLGDSFGMGWGVRREEMLATRLEAEMPATDVVNLSVAGYGTDQEVLTYEAEGVLYSADIVVLLFVLANDIDNNFRMSQRYQKPFFLPTADGLELRGVPVPYSLIESRKVPVGSSEFPVHDWLNTNSAFYSVVFDRLAAAPSIRRRWEESGLLHRQVVVFGTQDLDVLRKTYAREFEMGWRLTERILIRFRDAVCEQGAIPVVAIVPSHLQVYPEIWEEAVRLRRLNEDEFDTSGPNRRLASFCESQHLAVLDLLPALQEAPKSSLPLYYRKDPHWTPEGHRVASRALATYLQQGDLVGCPPRP